MQALKKAYNRKRCNDLLVVRHAVIDSIVRRKAVPIVDRVKSALPNVNIVNHAVIDTTICAQQRIKQVLVISFRLNLHLPVLVVDLRCTTNAQVSALTVADS